jgi:hypothetical protein
MADCLDRSARAGLDRDGTISSKAQNYRLWRGGAYGNKLRSWRGVDEWRSSGFRGRVALRSLVGGGGPCLYDLGPADLEARYRDWRASGIPGHAITIDEMAPAGSTVLQGEYLNEPFVTDDGGPAWGYFLYSRDRTPMRAALRFRSAVARGLVSDLMIKGAMTPSSYEDWRELLGRWPGHVLEVSIYDRCLGDVPHRNALVWEIRRY